jgi:hypothetical protein
MRFPPIQLYARGLLPGDKRVMLLKEEHILVQRSLNGESLFHRKHVQSLRIYFGEEFFFPAFAYYGNKIQVIPLFLEDIFRVLSQYPTGEYPYPVQTKILGIDNDGKAAPGLLRYGLPRDALGFRARKQENRKDKGKNEISHDHLFIKSVG